MSEYLCFNNLKDTTCCRCETTYKDSGYCCLDAFCNNNITSVDEYIDLMFKKNKMRKYMKHLPVIIFDNISVKFEVGQIPMTAACNETNSIYMDHCNKKDSINDIRVKAEEFIFKTQYCAECHGFKAYNNVTFELANCNTKIKISGKTYISPDKICTLSIHKYKKLKLNTSNTFPDKDKLNCTKRERSLCFNSFVAVFKKSNIHYANPFCAKCDNKTNFGDESCDSGIGPEISSEPHFRLLISFDRDTASHQVLETGDPVCSHYKYFDIFSDQCKKKPLSQTSGLPSSPGLTCVKNLNRSVIIPHNMSNLHYTQFTRTNVSFNYAEVKLAGTNFTTILKKSHKVDTLYIAPYSAIPYTQLYKFSLKNYLLYERVCADAELADNSFWVISECNKNSTGTIYHITNNVTYYQLYP